MLNRFIDWKKNIDHVKYFGLIAYFHTPDFELLREHIFSLFQYIPSTTFRSKLQVKENLLYEQNEYGEYYICEEDFNISMPLKPIYYFGLSKNILSETYIERAACQFRLDRLNSDFINRLAEIENLVYLVISNPFLTSWDNRKTIESYKYKKGIKTYFDKTKGMTFVDLSTRPGHNVEVGNFRRHGGYEYFFGSKYFPFCSKQKLLSFTNAKVVEEVNDRLVRIKLMDMKNYWQDESQSKLLDLKNHLKIDSLAEEYQSLLHK